MAKLSPSRHLSYNVLVDVLTHHQDPAESFEHHLAKLGGQMKQLDRNLAYEIIYGSLRWWSKLYAIVCQYSRRNLDQSSNVVKVALVAGTYQIYYLSRIPHRASVNESVEYVKLKNQRSATAYVNGILRQVAAKSQYLTAPPSHQFPVENLAYTYAFPPWMIKRWLSRFGAHKLEKILKASSDRPPVTIRISPFVDRHSPLLHRLIIKDEKTKPVRRPLPGCFHLRNVPDLSTQSLFGRGILNIQDESSQLIGYLVNPQLKDNIVDACAGPGGKLTHIYELAAFEYLKSTHLITTAGPKATEDIPTDDAHNVAETKSHHHNHSLKQLKTDFYQQTTTYQQHIAETLLTTTSEFPQIIAIEKKLTAFQKLIANVSRTQAQGIQCIHGDFFHYHPTVAPNKILLDAPCSGLGVLRRHPEGKLFKTKSLIDRMVLRQRELLQHAFEILAVGGEIIYSVCSFELEEGPEQQDWLVNQYRGHIEVLDLRQRLYGYYRRFITKDQLLMIYSGLSDGMDGFCAFVVKKTK